MERSCDRICVSQVQERWGHIKAKHTMGQLSTLAKSCVISGSLPEADENCVITQKEAALFSEEILVMK